MNTMNLDHAEIPDFSSVFLDSGIALGKDQTDETPRAIESQAEVRGEPERGRVGAEPDDAQIESESDYDSDDASVTEPESEYESSPRNGKKHDEKIHEESDEQSDGGSYEVSDDDSDGDEFEESEEESSGEESSGEESDGEESDGEESDGEESDDDASLTSSYESREASKEINVGTHGRREDSMRHVYDDEQKQGHEQQRDNHTGEADAHFSVDDGDEVCYEDTDLGGEDVATASLVAASLIAGGGAVRPGGGWTWTSIFIIISAAGGLGIVLLYAIKRINDLTRLVKTLEENSHMTINERDVQVITTQVIGDMLQAAEPADDPEDHGESAHNTSSYGANTDPVQREVNQNAVQQRQQSVAEVLRENDGEGVGEKIVEEVGAGVKNDAAEDDGGESDDSDGDDGDDGDDSDDSDDSDDGDDGDDGDGDDHGQVPNEDSAVIGKETRPDVVEHEQLRVEKQTPVRSQSNPSTGVSDALLVVAAMERQKDGHKSVSDVDEIASMVETMSLSDSEQVS